MDEGDELCVGAFVGVCIAAVAVTLAGAVREDKTNVLTETGVDFETMLRDPAHDLWFQKNLRFTQASFLRICVLLQHIKNPDTEIYRQHSFEKQVAATLFYLGSQGGFREVAQVFGVSKAWAIVRINDVLTALSTDYRRFIWLPRTPSPWLAVQRGFKQRAGMPLVCGAVDGTLIPVARFSDYEGWYCRKCFPAVNVQAVVDHMQRFISFDIRPGSWSDSKIWNASDFGQRIKSILPPGGFIVGDAGYTLSNTLLTPYEGTYDDVALQDEREAFYNHVHSVTRMVVECTFGDLKGRFRILRRPQEAKRLCNISSTIVSCMILHNIAVNLRDGTKIVDEEDLWSDDSDSDCSDVEDEGPTKLRRLSKTKEVEERRKKGKALRDDIANLLFR